MARTPRPAPDHLSYLRRAATAVASVSPLGLLRGAEARAHDMPLIGQAKLPADDVVNMTHVPSLAFPAATLDRISVQNGHAVVEGNWLGLTGPMGPLPLHLTEYAAHERRYAPRQPFGSFLDVLTGRMLQLFYRAWASAVPAASLDRGQDDHFGRKIAALTGAKDGSGGGEAFPAHARLRYAALFASPRSPSGIGDAVSDLLRLPARIVEHVARWHDIEPGDQSILGGGYASLGWDAVVGRRTYTVEDAVRVVVRVGTARDYLDLLPGGARYDLLVEAMDAFLPPHLEWEAELAVDSAAIRPARLGATSQLGWSSWVGPLQPGHIRSDTRLGANARRLAQHAIQENAA